MTSILQQWFAYPTLLWLLLLLLVLGMFAVRARRRRQRALMLLGARGLVETSLARRSWARRLRGSLLALGLLALLLGLAGPQWGRDWEQSTAKGRDLVVVLDLSRSMLAEKPSRLERAQRALLNLADTVQRRGGHRIALVGFAGRSKLLCPLTHDYDHFRETVRAFDQDHLDPELWPTEQTPSGTRMGLALMTAVEAHDPLSAGAQDILLVSDGDDPAGDGEWSLGVLDAIKRGICVHTAGVGNPTTISSIPFGEEALTFGGARVETKLEEGPLKEIARRTGGTYVSLQDAGYPLGVLFETRIMAGGDREFGDDALPQYYQRYALLLVPAFALLALSSAIGDGRRFRHGGEKP